MSDGIHQQLADVLRLYGEAGAIAGDWSKGAADRVLRVLGVSAEEWDRNDTVWVHGINCGSTPGVMMGANEPHNCNGYMVRLVRVRDIE